MTPILRQLQAIRPYRPFRSVLTGGAEVPVASARRKGWLSHAPSSPVHRGSGTSGEASSSGLKPHIFSQLQVHGSSVQVPLAQVSLNQRETLEETQGLLFRARGGRDRICKREGGNACQRYRV
jgi:hypothetical protein